jgi:hypothetical protein
MPTIEIASIICRKLPKRKGVKMRFLTTLFLVGFAISGSASAVETRLVLAGFEKPQVGVEVNFKRVQLKLTGSYWYSTGTSSLTHAWSISWLMISKSDYLLAPGLGVRLEHEWGPLWDQNGQTMATGHWLAVSPFVSLGVYRNFDRFFVGVNCMLRSRLYEQRNFGDSSLKGWVFTDAGLDPQFMFGYRF